MNIPAIVSLFKIVRDPALCLPHYTVSTFSQLPIPLSEAFRAYSTNGKGVEIKAVVLDKDNCFAVPHHDAIHWENHAKFKELIATYSAANILIVSNSSGASSKDPCGFDADRLERNTGVKVLRHSHQKPACGDEILAHFGDRIASPAQVAVIGDRLFTDVVMANAMGSYAVWVKQGVVPDRGLVTRIEYGVSAYLLRRGYRARGP